MVNCNSPRLDRVFRALADSTRRRILQQVVHSDCTVFELSKPFRISPPAISRHLKVLESAGLLCRVKTGKFHRFRLKTKPFTDVQQSLQELTTFWQQRLDHLENYLNHEQATSQKGIHERKP